MQRGLKVVLQNFERFSTSPGTVATSSKSPAQWDIFVSIALCRNPVIAPPMTAVEKEYASVISEIEAEQSLLSDFELQEAQDKKLLAKRAELEIQGKDLSELDEKIGVSATVMKGEWERRGKFLEEKYKLGNQSQVEKDSEKSVWRKLDRQLILLVKQRFQRKDNYISPWGLPQVINKPGETLRQTAERCISEVTNGVIMAQVLGNAPFSVYSYRYPKNLQRKSESGALGGKVFFFNTQLLQQGEIEINKDEIADYKWVIAEEFANTVTNRRYRKALSTLFIE